MEGAARALAGYRCGGLRIDTLRLLGDRPEMKMRMILEEWANRHRATKGNT
jgi:hypothetical protein